MNNVVIKFSRPARLISIVLLLMVRICLSAQSQTSNPAIKADSAAFNNAMGSSSKSLPFDAPYSKTLEDRVDSQTRAGMLKTEADYYRYMFTQRMAIYNWQMNSAKVLFFVVVLIVLIGLYLSYLQFKMSTAHIQHHITASARQVVFNEETKVLDQQTKSQQVSTEPSNTDQTDKTKSESSTDPQQPVMQNSKLEITKDGIKIDSAVIGLVILVVSIAFFFLYLHYVFPVKPPGSE